MSKKVLQTQKKEFFTLWIKSGVDPMFILTCPKTFRCVRGNETTETNKRLFSKSIQCVQFYRTDENMNFNFPNLFLKHIMVSCRITKC